MMTRVRTSPASRKRRRKWLKAARGYVGGRHRLLCTARETVMRAWRFSYRDRRLKKRNLRGLWIIRINAATRSRGMTYSEFMQGLSRAGVAINRKMLADLAVRDASGFSKIVDVAKGKA